MVYPDQVTLRWGYHLSSNNMGDPFFCGVTKQTSQLHSCHWYTMEIMSVADCPPKQNKRALGETGGSRGITGQAEFPFDEEDRSVEKDLLTGMSRLGRSVFPEEGQGWESAWKYLETSVNWVRWTPQIMLSTAET